MILDASRHVLDPSRFIEAARVRAILGDLAEEAELNDRLAVRWRRDAGRQQQRSHFRRPNGHEEASHVTDNFGVRHPRLVVTVEEDELEAEEAADIVLDNIGAFLKEVSNAP